jgi:Zn-dependent peptidase ImmA (M78 family)
MVRSYIQLTAEKLVRKYKTRCPFEVADSLNIQIIHGDLKTLKGFCKYFKRNRFIGINQNLCQIEKILTCSHELGHDRLHEHELKLLKCMKDYNIFCTSKNEYEANLFAAHFLIPDNLLSKYQLKNYTIEQIASNENLYPELIRLKFALK